jgi:hypothetical protein
LFLSVVLTFSRKVDAAKKTWKPSSEHNMVVSNLLASHQAPGAVGSAKAAHSSSFKHPVHSSLHKLSKPCNTQLSKKGSPPSLANKKTFSNGKIGLVPSSRCDSAVSVKDAVSVSSVLVKQNECVTKSISHVTPSENVRHAEKTLPVSSDDKSRRQSDVNEPTRQPVAARMAAWKKKTATVEESMSASHRQLRANTIAITDEKKGVKAVNLQIANANCKPTVGKQSMFPSTSDQILSCNDKFHAVRTSSSDVKSSPLKKEEIRQLSDGLSPRKREMTSASNLSPKKLGPATLGIQQKLSAMCESWKKNEITEKNRQERATDMALLENRWKNGILVEEDVSSKQKVDSKSASLEPSVTSKPLEPSVASKQPVTTAPQVCSYFQLLFS